MRRVLLLAATLAVVAGTAGANAPAKPEHESVYGLIHGTSGYAVARLDRDTLRPVGRKVPVGYMDDFAYDWNGWLAYVDGLRLRVIDPEKMKLFTSIRLPAGGPVAVAWLQWGAIVLVTDSEVRRVDWFSGKVTRTARFDGGVVARARGHHELVLLLAPKSGIGAARLMVIDGRGRARVIPVPRIAVGTQVDLGNDPPTGQSRLPGLALDAARQVAYVVGDGLVAEIPLAGVATYHALRGTFAKVIAGSWHSAAWLGGGTLAVTGRASSDGRRSDAMGLGFVDTTTWATRLVDRDVSLVTAWQDLALAPGALAGGLAAFDSSGAERFRLLAGQDVSVVATTPARAYLQTSNEWAAVELPSGRIVARPGNEFRRLLVPR
jgi:hypothetical protein